MCLSIKIGEMIMSSKAMKRIRRSITEEYPQTISKKEFRKLEIPSKSQEDKYAKFKSLYNAAKVLYNRMGAVEKTKFGGY